MKKGDTMLDGNDSFAAGAAVASTRVKTWEIVIDGCVLAIDRTVKVYGTGLTVIAASLEDGRMQAQARLPQMHPKHVYVRNLADDPPSGYVAQQFDAATLEFYSTSPMDNKAQKQWDLLVQDCESLGMPFRSTGIKVIAGCHDHAFVAANRLLHRLHPAMLKMREVSSQDCVCVRAWRDAQVVRILEVFGALTEQAPAAEQEAAAVDTPCRFVGFKPSEALTTCIEQAPAAEQEAAAVDTPCQSVRVPTCADPFQVAFCKAQQNDRKCSYSPAAQVEQVCKTGCTAPTTHNDSRGENS